MKTIAVDFEGKDVMEFKRFMEVGLDGTN